MYIFDATPLIYLAKVDRLELLDALPSDCVVPDRVYTEVVTRGIEQDHPDARRIERAVEDGRLERVSVPGSTTFDRLQRNDRLSTADSAVLAIADERDGTAIMDETYGRDVAAAEEIPTRGTAYLVLWLLRADRIDGSEASEIIDAMLDEGWYCAPDLYKSLQRKIDELS